MSEPEDELLISFLKCIMDLIDPVSGEVTFGNVRYKITRAVPAVGETARLEAWEPVTNVAITYESPGGSTNQINIAYEHGIRQFRMLSDSSGEEDHFPDPTPIVQKIDDLIKSIPQIRLDRLKWDIDRWIAEGRTRPQILATMSRYLQTDSGLKGGGITHDEFREASRYIAQQMKPDNDRKSDAND